MQFQPYLAAILQAELLLFPRPTQSIPIETESRKESRRSRKQKTPPFFATAMYPFRTGTNIPEDQDLSETRNVVTVQRFVEEVINRGRLEAADELVHEDFVELDPLPGQRQGRQGLKDVIGMIRTGFPDIDWVIEETIASGDKVVTRFKWSGTHRGDFLGVPATGRKVTVHGVVIDRLSDGMMADSRILMNTLGLMQQLGVIPGPPSA
jgi:steroid delta-isomerase-like uncharacterized protein